MILLSDHYSELSDNIGTGRITGNFIQDRVMLGSAADTTQEQIMFYFFSSSSTAGVSLPAVLIEKNSKVQQMEEFF